MIYGSASIYHSVYVPLLVLRYFDVRWLHTTSKIVLCGYSNVTKLSKTRVDNEIIETLKSDFFCMATIQLKCKNVADLALIAYLVPEIASNLET